MASPQENKASNGNGTQTLEALRQSNEALRLLAEISHYLLTVDDSQRYVKQVYEQLKPHLNLDVCFNYLAVENEPKMRLDFFDGIPPEVGERIRYLKHGEAICGCVAVQQSKLVAEDIAHSSDERAALVRSFGVQVYACHPLLVNGRFLGTLSFGSRAKTHFTAEELALMEAIAAQVAAAMDRLRLIASLRQQADELADANRRKDEFLAMLGHELRNPLAAIRNGLHIQKLSDGNAAIAAQIHGMLDKQVNHLTRMVDDLLDVGRITRGKIQLRKEKIELAKVVGNAVESVRPLTEARNHKLTIALPSEPVYLEADPTCLEQVLVNLLTNATKYTKPNGYITIMAEREGENIGVRVKDNGCGIRADLLPKIFDLFTQGEQGIDRPEGGLGIGLTLVKKLVEMHGGSIEAHSDGLEKGSEFVVRLPALPSDRSEQAPTCEQSSANGKVRVLVVEDAEDLARSIKMLLEFWGHDVRVVNDGPTALVAYRTYQPDVVLLDIGLPGMSGYDVARQLRRQQAKKRPLIMAVTGYGHDEAKQQSREAGFDYHMTKPVEPDTLHNLISSVPALVSGRF